MANKAKTIIYTIIILAVFLIAAGSIVLVSLMLGQNNDQTSFITNTNNINITTNDNVNEVIEDEEDVIEKSDDNSSDNRLTVEWNEEPVQHDISNYDFTIPEDLQEYEDDVNDFYKVYQVGIVNSEPFQGKPFLLIERTCNGPCGIGHYRVIDDRDDQGLILLRIISNQIWEGDHQYFTISDAYDVSELHYAEFLNIEYDTRTLSFEAEEFSPAVLFKDYAYNIWDNNASRIKSSYLRHDVYGTLYERDEGGIFMVKLPDHTVKIYRLEFPFELSKGDGYTSYLDSTGIYIPVDTNNERNKSISGSYTPISIQNVCPPVTYSYISDIEDRLVSAGTLDRYYDKREVFILEDDQDELYKEIYEWGWEPSYTYEEMISDYPLIFLKDDLERWLMLVNVDYYPSLEAGCGYLNSVL